MPHGTDRPQTWDKSRSATPNWSSLAETETQCSIVEAESLTRASDLAPQLIPYIQTKTATVTSTTPPYAMRAIRSTAMARPW